MAFGTGAGSGIGEQLARLFAQQGAHVVLADIRPDAAERVAGDIQASGGSVRAEPLDVAEESEVKAAIEKIAATDGRLEIVFNNSGTSTLGTISASSSHDC